MMPLEFWVGMGVGLLLVTPFWFGLLWWLG